MILEKGSYSVIRVVEIMKDSFHDFVKKNKKYIFEQVKNFQTSDSFHLTKSFTTNQYEEW